MHFVLLYLVAVISICKADDFKFGFQRSTEWQFVGRKVQLTLTMDIPESTPLKIKIKLPFNGTALMRLTEVKFTFVSEHLSASVNTTTLTSSANDGLNDAALIDLGNVTRASSANKTEIKIHIEVQVLNHPHNINGEAQWVSLGVEYGKNQSIWAAQLAVTIVNPASSRPHLKVEIWPDRGDYNLETEGIVKFRLRLTHSTLTTEEVQSGIIEWPLPPVLTFKKYKQVKQSINVDVLNNTDMVTIKFGRLNFSDTVNLQMSFHLDLHKTKADGKVHDLTVYVNVRYNGSVNTCSSASGSREFTNDESAANSMKYYSKRQTCEEALGMEDGSIDNAQITASSYATGGEPHEGRMGGAKAWIPHGLLAQDKHQFLEVNFTSKVKICRLTLKGLDQNFVRSFKLYYSNDGVIWTPYKHGSKIKVFVGMSNADFGARVILPVCFEAVFVRINPTAWQNGIALKLELYGCKLNQPLTPGPLKFSRRGYLLDKANNIMFACSVPMESRRSASKCFFSTNIGDSWKVWNYKETSEYRRSGGDYDRVLTGGMFRTTELQVTYYVHTRKDEVLSWFIAMDHDVISLLGLDTVENILFGVGLNGKALVKSTTDHSAKFKAVLFRDWDTAKAKGTTEHAVMIGNDLAITNTTITPLAEHIVTSSSGTKWGVSAQGFHVEDSVWKLKAFWGCSGP